MSINSSVKNRKLRNFLADMTSFFYLNDVTNQGYSVNNVKILSVKIKRTS